jgi:hypothetical protein
VYGEFLHEMKGLFFGCVFNCGTGSLHVLPEAAKGIAASQEHRQRDADKGEGFADHGGPWA